MKLNSINGLGIFGVIACFAALVAVGCGGSGNNPTTGSTGSNPPPPPALRTIAVWTTTNVAAGGSFAQRDRLANPVINEVFATVANNRHQINDEQPPTGDPANLANDVQSFMTGVAGRSQAITDVVKAVVVPDTMKVDLRAAGNAAYLGVQTNGATGGTFGGRALTDDVVDISLGIVFGGTIPALGLAPDDGNEIPTLTSDNVGAGGKHFTNTFPYIGAPR